MSGRGDTRRPVNVEADVAFFREERRSRVERHAHAHRSRRESRLSVGRRPEGTGGGRERDEEGVALRVHLDPATCDERFAQDAPMLREHVRVSLAQLVQQPGRALDVGEQKRDGAGRKLGHRIESGCGRSGRPVGLRVDWAVTV